MSVLSDIEINEIKRIIPEDRIALDEPMSEHTTFRVGGPAGALVTVVSNEELAGLTMFLRNEGIDYMILGNGSNLLVSDKGYDGVAIRLAGEFEEISVDGDRVTAGAGVLFTKLAMAAQQEGLSGLEFSYGIPGTLGGAAVMNAGAYGGELKDVAESVKVMDETGKVTVFTAAEMAFGYRDSIIKHRDLIVLEVRLKLQKGDPSKIMDRMLEHMAARKSKQPLEFPSAGSTFKRPEGNYAGKLIQEAGLAGRSVGGAEVSSKHCGFVINKGRATAGDIALLMDIVQTEVFKSSGIRLEPEVIKVGKF